MTYHESAGPRATSVARATTGGRRVPLGRPETVARMETIEHVQVDGRLEAVAYSNAVSRGPRNVFAGQYSSTEEQLMQQHLVEKLLEI